MEYIANSKLHTEVLNRVNYPDDLKNLSMNELIQLANEIRHFIFEEVSKIGGHFSSGLGVVELTIALHYVFNAPQDKIFWDVGHQTYPHKILTGRKSKFHTLRKYEGLNPFSCPKESDYDTLTTGHAGNSIGYALAEAVKNKLTNDSNKSIAVIGDGSLNCGMAFEALNHAGGFANNMMVIINDNNMSISKNVGAMSNFLAKFVTSYNYQNIRNRIKKCTSKHNFLGKIVRKLESQLKSFISPSMMFESLGFNYIGPIDGHNLPNLIKTLTNIKNIENSQRPKIIHLVTKKGKGFNFAEDDPIKFHALYKIETNKPKKPSYSNVFGNWLNNKAAIDNKIFAITPAMCEGSDLKKFAKNYPERFADVGIAEQHALTFGGGLAKAGLKPVVAIYSTFLQRAYDQLIHDVSIDNLNLLLAIDRAGIVGADGATHNGLFDVSYLQTIPNLVVMAPSNEHEMEKMLDFGLDYDGVAAVRYPRLAITGRPALSDKKVELGKAVILQESQKQKIALLTFGTLINDYLTLVEEYDLTLVDMRFIKPIDQGLILKLAKTHQYIITAEENYLLGGVGATIAKLIATSEFIPKVINLGINDKFIEHGDRPSLIENMLGIDQLKKVILSCK